MMQNNEFRDDLYFRLKMSPLHLPPLRRRRNDVIPLANHFIAKGCKRFNKKKPAIPKEVFTLLTGYSFPGNVRELEGIIMNALAQESTDSLSLEAFENLIKGKENSMKKRKPLPGNKKEGAPFFISCNFNLPDLPP